MERKEIQAMAAKWPSTVVSRSAVDQFTGGAIKPKTLANEDSRGTGPDGRFKMGRQTVYPVAALVQWLEARCQ